MSECASWFTCASGSSLWLHGLSNYWVWVGPKLQFCSDLIWLMAVADSEGSLPSLWVQSNFGAYMSQPIAKRHLNSQEEGGQVDIWMAIFWEGITLPCFVCNTDAGWAYRVGPNPEIQAKISKGFSGDYGVKLIWSFIISFAITSNRAVGAKETDL